MGIQCLTDPLAAAALIDAYFSSAYSLLPALDEAHFRSRDPIVKSSDDGWLGLRNVVLAIGSFSCSMSNPRVHFAYFAQSLKHIGRTASLETVQALLMLGGQYLIYIDQHNMAGLLLHKATEMAESIGPKKKDWGNEEKLPAAWRCTIRCLSSLDQDQATQSVSSPATQAEGTWRMRLANTIRCQMRVNSSNFLCEPLDVFMTFCHFFAQVHKANKQSQETSGHHYWELDQKLTHICDRLRSSISSSLCQGPSNVSLCIMKWRFMSLRMLLHWPLLRAAAVGNERGVGLNGTAKDAAKFCRQLSAELVDDIEREWIPSQICTWMAARILHQVAEVATLICTSERDEWPFAQRQHQMTRIFVIVSNMADCSWRAREIEEEVGVLFDRYWAT